MEMWAKYILVIGVCTALITSALVTVPYVLAWSSLNSLSREMNIIALNGTTYSDHLTTTVANITLVAAYPKAAVYAQGTMFSLQLFFFVELDPQITWFSGDITDIYFLELGSKDPNLIGFIFDPTDHSTLFTKLSESGYISPFFVNCSAAVRANRWPPAFASNLLYFTGSYQVYPEIALNAMVSTINNSSFNNIGFGFITEGYPVTIYGFNYPPTLWAAYGSSVVIAASVSLNYYLSRKRLKIG